MRPGDFNRCNDVCGRSDHKVRLDPLASGFSATPLVAIPPIINGRSEAGRIGSKVGLDSAERSGTFFNECLENRGDLGVFKGVEDTVKMRSAVDIAACSKFLHINHSASARRSAVNLHNRAKDCIREWKSGTPILVNGVIDCRTKAMEQGCNALFFNDLSSVIRRPILTISQTLRVHITILPKGIVPVNLLGLYLTYIPTGYRVGLCLKLGFGVTVASGAIMSGCRGIKTRSRKSAPSASHRIGTRPAERSPLGLAA